MKEVQVVFDLPGVTVDVSQQKGATATLLPSAASLVQKKAGDEVDGKLLTQNPTSSPLPLSL